MKRILIWSSIVIIEAVVIFFLYKTNSNNIQKYNNSIETIKAYDNENSKLKESNRVFKYTIDQLNYYEDSLLVKMNNIRKELKIKDNQLSSMQYLLSTLGKNDTILFRDTIFTNKVNIDTTIRDKWYAINLKLRYPNYIEVNPQFTSEKYIIVSNKKETVNPPSKWFFIRWFQKKHTILEVLVIDKSPYETNKSQKFIEIIK